MGGIVVTYNSSSALKTLTGLVGNQIYIGKQNLIGGPTIIIIHFPHIPHIPIVIPCPAPNQILGFVGLNSCSPTECRTYPESEYINPVLADLNNPDVFKNDSNTFIIKFDAWYSPDYITTIKLQEQTAGGSWSDIATLNNNNYGTYYRYYGRLYPSNITYVWNTTHPDYMGYKIEWRKVLNAFGEGIYRLNFSINNNSYLFCRCGVSEPFCLKTYSCANAQNTVKFEITLNGGVIGDADNTANLIDLCSMTYTDSIRFEGFFNYEKDEYDRKNVEYNNGIIYKVRDKVIKKFDLQTGRLPYWLHSRFRAYGLMADKLLVSDYNNNNPNYNINRKGVIADSGYEPMWNQSTRFARVKCSFKEDQQNLIRRRCCYIKGGQV